MTAPINVFVLMLDLFIRGNGTAPKHMFLLMLDPMSNMQTFACSIHVKAKKQM